jgi:hypothetical protein
MAIKDAKKLNRGKVMIDLRGPQGNAFVLLGTARRLCRQLGIEWEPINKDMTSGDYEHLIKVFDQHFGACVDLYR